MNHYYKLGKLPLDFIEFFRDEIIKRTTSDNYQWVQFDEFLHSEFLKYFENSELKIQTLPDSTVHVQKALCSKPGYGFTIHKDGFNCKSALNIVLSGNSTDWIKWYDEDLISKVCNIKKIKDTSNGYGYAYSRNTNLKHYEYVPHINELHTEIGDVYVLDVDQFHSFKCVGENQRIVIQTKFDGFPNLETIYNSLKHKSFKNLITF